MNKLTTALVLASLLSGCGAMSTAPLSPAARAAVIEAQAKKAVKKKPAAALAAASRWVAANSGGSFWDDPRKHLFPASDDGNNGTGAYAYADADGQWFADFAKAWFQAYRNPPQFTFDPRTDLMIAVVTSDDEPVVMVAHFDRQTGKGRLLGELGIVDLSLPQAQFSKFFPKLGKVDEVDYFEVLTAIEARGAGI